MYPGSILGLTSAARCSPPCSPRRSWPWGSSAGTGRCSGLRSFPAPLRLLTLAYFVHLGYLAEEVTAAGLVLAGLAFGVLRWLRAGADRRRGAFTAEPLLEPRLYGLDFESLAAMQPLAPATETPQVGGFRPGGGSFGGGGVSGGY